MHAETERTEETSLVAALQAGDQTASVRLVSRYQGLLFGVCIRILGHRQDAEDVLQETFVRAIRAIHRFDGERALRPWLLGIAANRCRTALAQRKRHPVCTNLDDGPLDPGTQNPTFLDLRAEIDRALSLLRPEYREVFLLFHDQGLSYEAIGERLNRPTGTIKTWLHRARAELASELERRGITA